MHPRLTHDLKCLQSICPHQTYCNYANNAIHIGCAYPVLTTMDLCVLTARISDKCLTKLLPRKRIYEAIQAVKRVLTKRAVHACLPDQRSLAGFICRCLASDDFALLLR
jgi:hypothetical protein